MIVQSPLAGSRIGLRGKAPIQSIHQIALPFNNYLLILQLLFFAALSEMHGRAGHPVLRRDPRSYRRVCELI
jgi:hypothetical protein